MRTIYLAGPINGRSDADCRDWREEAKRLLAPLKTRDPMARDYRGREMEPGIATEIVENDLNDIRYSDALLVMFDTPSVGTAMEVFFAHRAYLPVHVVNASGKPPSPWLVYHSKAIHSSLDEACDAIRLEMGT